MRRGNLALVPASLLLTALLAGGAEAAWSSAVTTATETKAATLPVPEAVTSACTSTGDIIVTWSSSTSAPVVARYLVQRSADAGGTWADAATLAASTSTTYSYEDLNLPLGSYSYRVQSLTGGWSALSATSATRTLVEAKGKKPRAVSCS